MKENRRIKIDSMLSPFPPASVKGNNEFQEPLFPNELVEAMMNNKAHVSLDASSKNNDGRVLDYC